MGKRVGLLAGLLVGLGSSVMAQSPSPSAPPSPWVAGQRVQMSEHGFAVTVPDGWAAFHPDGDEAQLAEVIVTWTGRGATDDDVRAVAEQIATARQEGVQLMLVEGASESTCILTVRTKRAIETGEFAVQLASAMASDDRYIDVEPPRAIELPAGAAFAIRGSRPNPDWLARSVPLTQYLVDSDRALLFATCVGPVRPADDWRSIVETFEFLPGE
jgi:hypothetical protein